MRARRGLAFTVLGVENMGDTAAYINVYVPQTLGPVSALRESPLQVPRVEPVSASPTARATGTNVALGVRPTP